MATKRRPTLDPRLCKGCARCIDACAKGCIAIGTEIQPETGLLPVVLHLDDCSSCGLCIDACPEPYGLMDEAQGWEMPEPAGARARTLPEPPSIPDEILPLPACGPLALKGNYASAIGALLAGCRHVFGYPITPSTEGAELMAKLLPELDGVFLQAVSEVATVNMMYGCGGAGKRTMTFTSSPGFSLMVEGISYMVGAELPGVFMNVMRAGPGLGNIAPEQSDIKLVCRGLGHGNTHAIVLAPSTPQEMLDLTRLAFELSFKYRNPVILASDGYLGQMTGRVTLPEFLVKPGMPGWAVAGDGPHRGNVINSIRLSETDLEAHNVHLNEKFARMSRDEQRADLFQCEDAEVLVVACNTPARMAKGAVQVLRQQGLRVGLFRPLTLWPFPIDALLPLLFEHDAREILAAGRGRATMDAGVLGRAHRTCAVRRIVVVEASPGQLEDELRLALSHAGVRSHPDIESVRHYGGVLPQTAEIVAKLREGMEVAA